MCRIRVNTINIYFHMIKWREATRIRSSYKQICGQFLVLDLKWAQAKAGTTRRQLINITDGRPSIVINNDITKYLIVVHSS